MLPDTRLARQNVVLQTLGYGRFSDCAGWLSENRAGAGCPMLAVLTLVPSLLWMSPLSWGRIRLPAVLAWQWLTRATCSSKRKGLLCLLMLALLAVLSALGSSIWKAWRRTLPALTGCDARSPSRRPPVCSAESSPHAACCAGVLLMLAQWDDDVSAVRASLSFGLLANPHRP